MSVLCIGPTDSGKTLLLKKLQDETVGSSTSTVETKGTNIVSISKKPKHKEKPKSRENKDAILVREIGGCMAPLWPSYYSGIKSVSNSLNI